MQNRFSLFTVITSMVITYCVFAQQVKWPAASNETKPWTRWWWQGSAVNKEELTRLLKLYNDAGLGGVEVTPIFGVRGEESKFINYLGPQWMDMLQHTLNTAGKLGMGVDMATGTGWPFGGPWISYEDACKQVVTKTWKLNKGESVPAKISCIQEPLLRGASNKPPKPGDVKDPVESNTNLQQLAIDQVKFARPLPLITVMAYPKGGTPVELTGMVGADSVLNWVSPADDCEVYALFMGWHGKMVERAAPGGEGNAIDHFSRKAIDTYFTKFDDAFKGHDISSLRGFFNDSYEVDDARGQSNWTPQFFDEFNKRRGYDLKLYLPALFGKATPEQNERILYDYRQTITELILHNFTEPWVAWAKGQKALVRNQSHGSPGNTMDLYAAVDIPETEGTELLRFKFATSATHVTGKKLAAAEACTWLGEHFTSTLGDVKQALDRYFVGGVNHIVYHGTNYSPANAPWPGWLFYAAVHFHPSNPFWKQFPAINKYVERCQSFLQAGKPDNDILVYYPFADAQMERGRDLLKHYDAMRPEFNGTYFAEISEWMLKKGYSFDFISDKQLTGVTTTGGKLQTGGAQYQAILLPYNKYIPLATMQQIVKLVEAGATLLIYGSPPADVPGFANHKEDRDALDALVRKMQFTMQDGYAKAVMGKGLVYMSEKENVLLNAATIRREPIVDLGLQFIRRTYNGGHAYFITNPGTKAVDTVIDLDAQDAYAALYNPMTGEAGIVKPVRIANKMLGVRLQLPAGASCIVQTAPKVLTGAAYRYYQPAGQSTVVKGTWRINFLPADTLVPLPKQLTIPSSWTEWGPNYAWFSGTAAYTISLDKPAASAQAWKLDLGKVGESANVFVNDKLVGTVVGPDYSVILPDALLKPTNVLRIEVSNSMANRIIFMERQGINYKRFYNTNFPARLPENRGPDGLFTAAKWQPRPSGLLDLVRLTPLQIVTQ